MQITLLNGSIFLFQSISTVTMARTLVLASIMAMCLVSAFALSDVQPHDAQPHAAQPHAAAAAIPAPAAPTAAPAHVDTGEHLNCYM